MAASKNTTEARQGESKGRMPVVLGISIALILLAFGSVYGYSQMYASKNTYAAQHDGDLK